jgi:serine protease AprX
LPDVVAPAVSIPSLHVAGSNADDEIVDDCVATTRAASPQPYKQPVFGPNGRFVRASGTSQAAAMVTGDVALLLSKNPDLKPDVVKALLEDNATTLPGGPGNVLQGHGVVNMFEAYAATLGRIRNAYQSFRADGGGSLDDARGGDVLTDDPNLSSCAAPAPSSCLTGNEDIFGRPVDLGRLERAEKAFSAWSVAPDGSEVWAGDNVAWAQSGFQPDPILGSSWGGRPLLGLWAAHAPTRQAWTGRRWSDLDISGRSWSSDGLSGRRWSNGALSGRRWSDDSLSGRSWSGRSWSDNAWS